MEVLVSERFSHFEREVRLAAAALWQPITDAGQYLEEFIKRHREQQP